MCGIHSANGSALRESSANLLTYYMYISDKGKDEGIIIYGIYGR